MTKQWLVTVKNIINNQTIGFNWPNEGEFRRQLFDKDRK